jgi:hypothetical protein
VWLFVLGAFLSVYFVGKWCHTQTDGFQLTHITSPLAASPRWELPSLTKEEKADLKNALSRPFTYLDSGGQTYAFISEDKRLVLKLFKMHHLTQYSFLYKRSFPGVADLLRLQLLSLQKCKLFRAFDSSALAYTHLREQTGLLYLNLNPDPQLQNLSVTLIDKLGIRHKIDLSHTPFALQLCAQNAFKVLRRHIKNHDLEAGKKVIDEILLCLKERHAQGIIDIDPSLRRNMGLTQERAIAIDIGAFFIADYPLSAQELVADTLRMHRWLEKRSFELTAYFDKQLQETP